MIIQKTGKKIVDKDLTSDGIRKKITPDTTYIREGKLSDALANLYQMMQIRNDGYWSLLRE